MPPRPSTRSATQPADRAGGKSADKSGGRPWHVANGTVIVRFRVTPRGGRDAIDGLTVTADGPAFKARVRAVPEDGAANAALIALVAVWLDIRTGDVTLIAGHKSRVKSLAVAAEVARLETMLKERADTFEASTGR